MVVQWLRICLEVQGTCVLSLVGELKCHMPPKHLNQDLVQPNKIIKLMFKKKVTEFFKKKKKERKNQRWVESASLFLSA